MSCYNMEGATARHRKKVYELHINNPLVEPTSSLDESLDEMIQWGLEKVLGAVEGIQAIDAAYSLMYGTVPLTHGMFNLRSPRKNLQKIINEAQKMLRNIDLKDKRPW